MTARPDSGSDSHNQRGAITLKEIRQQPELWPTTLERVASSNAHSLVQGRPAVICGAGTSAYAASAVAATWTNAVAIPTTDLLTFSLGELSHLTPEFASNGVLVSLGRSGDSPESVGVIERFKQACPKAVHLAITCNEHGQLARLPGVTPLILDPRTNDRSLVMTGSFSNLLLAGMAATVNKAFPSFEKVAQRLSSQPSSRLMVLASAGMTPLAKEASLKVLE